MKAILLHPKPYSQFRLGKTGLTDVADVLHSDTLFSALANIYEMALSGAEKLIELVRDEKITFSSGFYVLVLGEHKVFFLPKLMCQFVGADISQRKKEKKIRYLSLGVYREVLKTLEEKESEILTASFSLLNSKDATVIGGEFLCLKEELRGWEFEERAYFRTEIELPKVKVHTTELEDRFYTETNIQFLTMKSRNGQVANGGFYVLIKTNENLSQEEYAELITAFRILADEGIGGERSIGCGQFERIEEVTIDGFPVTQSSTPKYFLGLSLFSPNSQSEFDAARQYELIWRGGGSIGKYGDVEAHRKRVRLIAEGAILKGEVKGRLVDISPDVSSNLLNKIYRNGKAFTIPIL